MKIFVKFIMISIILGLYACKQQAPPQDDVANTASSTDEIYQFPVLNLDQGKLWEANIETIQGIKNMQVRLANYSTTKDFQVDLIDDLKTEFTLIFKNCTMKGEAHEVLHDYLIHLKMRIDDLSEAITPAKIDSMSNYLEVFFDYFQ